MFQRTCVPVFDQIVQQSDIPVIHCLLEFSERDAGGIDNGRLRPEMIDQADPSLSVEHLDMIVGRNIQLLHHSRFSFFLTVFFYSPFTV